MIVDFARELAKLILTDTENFGGLLSSNENTVQKALDKFDDLNIGILLPDQTGNAGKVIGTDGHNVSWVIGGVGGWSTGIDGGSAVSIFSEEMDGGSSISVYSGEINADGA